MFVRVHVVYSPDRKSYATVILTCLTRITKTYNNIMAISDTDISVWGVQNYWDQLLHRGHDESASYKPHESRNVDTKIRERQDFRDEKTCIRNIILKTLLPKNRMDQMSLQNFRDHQHKFLVHLKYVECSTWRMTVKSFGSKYSMDFAPR